MPAIAPDESPPLSLLGVGLGSTDSEMVVLDVSTVVMSDASAVVMLDVSAAVTVDAVEAASLEVAVMSVVAVNAVVVATVLSVGSRVDCAPHRITVPRRQKVCRRLSFIVPRKRGINQRS